MKARKVAGKSAANPTIGGGALVADPLAVVLREHRTAASVADVLRARAADPEALRNAAAILFAAAARLAREEGVPPLAPGTLGELGRSDVLDGVVDELRAPVTLPRRWR